VLPGVWDVVAQAGEPLERVHGLEVSAQGGVHPRAVDDRSLPVGVHELPERQRVSDEVRGGVLEERSDLPDVVATITLALLATGEGVLWLLLIVGGFRLFSAEPGGAGDRRATVTFAGLVLLLSALAALPVPFAAP
jgi:hypothetical protein